MYVSELVHAVNHGMDLRQPLHVNAVVPNFCCCQASFGAQALMVMVTSSMLVLLASHGWLHFALVWELPIAWQCKGSQLIRWHLGGMSITSFAQPFPSSNNTPTSSRRMLPHAQPATLTSIWSTFPPYSAWQPNNLVLHSAGRARKQGALC